MLENMLCWTVTKFNVGFGSHALRFIRCKRCFRCLPCIGWHFTVLPWEVSYSINLNYFHWTPLGNHLSFLSCTIWILFKICKNIRARCISDRIYFAGLSSNTYFVLFCIFQPSDSNFSERWEAKLMEAVFFPIPQIWLHFVIPFS